MGKFRDWYNSHRFVRGMGTALAGGLLLNSAADSAAEIFFNRPVAAAVKADERQSLTISGISGPSTEE